MHTPTLPNTMMQKPYLSILAAAVLLAFAPLACFLFTIARLFFIHENEPITRRSLMVLGWASLVVIYASHSFKYELLYDLKVYYQVYEQLIQQHLSALFFFENGIEVGYPALLWLVSLLLPKLSPIQLAIGNALLCIVLLIIWFEHYGMKHVVAEQSGKATLLYW